MNPQRQQKAEDRNKASRPGQANTQAKDRNKQQDESSASRMRGGKDDNAASKASSCATDR